MKKMLVNSNNKNDNNDSYIYLITQYNYVRFSPNIIITFGKYFFYARPCTLFMLSLL